MKTIDPNKKIEIISLEEKFDSNSSFSLILTLPTFRFPKWYLNKYQDIEISPNYYITNFINTPNSYISLRQYRRDTRKYNCHLYNTRFRNLTFLFKHRISHNKNTLVEITDELFNYGFCDKRPINLNNQHIDLSSISKSNLLNELENRYKEELGGKWSNAVNPSISDVRKIA